MPGTPARRGGAIEGPVKMSDTQVQKTYLRFFSAGDIIALGTATVMLAVSWGSLTAQMNQQAKDMADIKSQLAHIQQSSPADSDRISRLEERQKANDEFKVEVKIGLQRLEDKLDRIYVQSRR